MNHNFMLKNSSDYHFKMLCIYILQEADVDLGDVEEGFDRLTTLSKRLANHYCENEHTFNLDEFINTFKEFCEKVKACEQVHIS